jgi:hypothetical protein
LQLARTVRALVDRHAAGEYTRASGLAGRASLREIADPREQGSAPASQAGASAQANYGAGQCVANRGCLP